MASISPRRGEIWLIDFGEPVGREQSGVRPAVVVSVDLWNEGRSGLVIVVPTTTVGRGLRTQVEIDNRLSGLDETSYARCEDVKSVPVERLMSGVGTASVVDMTRIETVLRYLLAL